MVTTGYPEMPELSHWMEPPSFSQPAPATLRSYSQMDPAALELEKQRLQLEYMRLEAERREREERREIEGRQQREREAYEREGEAAHQRAMQLHAQSQSAQATLAAQTAMATTAQACGGRGAAVVTTEKYCGPISWIIGLFLFPCICCCPVDTRPVTVVQPPVTAYVAPIQYGVAAPGIPIYNAPGHVTATK